MCGNSPKARRLRSLLVMLATLGLGSQAVGQELPFTHFTTEHPTTPLTSASVQKIHQDREGYIWFGYYSTGLARYDGHALEQYSIEDGLPDLTVREIVEDDRGRLWIGTDGGLVASEKPLSDHAVGERIRFTSSVGGVPLIATRIRHNGLAADRAGWVWVATTGDGILAYRWRDRLLERRVVPTPALPGGSNQAVHAILVRHDSSVWASLAGTAVAHFRPSAGAATLTALGRDDGLPAADTSALYESTTGVVWGGCTDGTIWRLDDSRGRVEIVNQELSERIFDIAEASDGDLWIGSLGSGALRLDSRDPKTSRRVGTENGLLDETLWSVLQDREGNLWLGQNGGVSRLTSDYKAFDYYTGRLRAARPPLLPGQSAFAVVPPGGGAMDHLLIGTSGGFVAVAPDGSTETIRAKDGLWSNAVYSMLVDSRGGVWIGTSGGLNAITFTAEKESRAHPVSLFGRPARVERLEPHGRPIYSIVNVSIRRGEDQQERVETVWAGGAGGLLAFDESSRYLLRSAAGLPPTGVTSIAVDPWGYIWTGSNDAGVFRSRVPITQTLLRQWQSVEVDGAREITETVFEPIWNRQSGAPTNGIRNLLSHEGEIWAATAAGVVVFDARSARPVSTIDRRHGVGSNSIAGLIFARGRIWMTQNLGIVEIDPRSRKVLRIVTHQDGLLHNEAWAFSSLAAGEDGSLYFASPKGVTIFRPWLQRRDRSTPLLRLRRVDLKQDARGSNQIAIEYAALSFANEQKIRYRTRLTGFEDDFSAPTKNVAIRYTNLAALLTPRTYRFQVIASSDPGRWSPPLEYAFEIRPAWWRTWWAILLYAAAIVLASGVFHRLRTLALQRRNAALEALVAERTREIRLQTEELEAKKREAEQASQAKSTFLANMSHELRTPLNSIIGFSEILVERFDGKLDQKPMSFLRSIASSAQHLLSLISDILDLSKVDAGKMDFSPEAFPVRSSVEGVCHIMRGVAAHKGQTFQVSIPVDLPCVEADPVKFKQILSNLLSNAVKFSPPASVIRISAAHLQGASGEMIEVSVADPGIGIAPENLDVIFEEFKQIDAGRSREFGGTGLGLALVKKFVELQGGSVRVTSEVGEGSTFSFTLPARSGEQRRPATGYQQTSALLSAADRGGPS
jgi:signal transduction histidine kinase/ligand-binding sensor domain-containing protein